MAFFGTPTVEQPSEEEMLGLLQMPKPQGGILGFLRNPAVSAALGGMSRGFTQAAAAGTPTGLGLATGLAGGVQGLQTWEEQQAKAAAERVNDLIKMRRLRMDEEQAARQSQDEWLGQTFTDENGQVWVASRLGGWVPAPFNAPGAAPKPQPTRTVKRGRVEVTEEMQPDGSWRVIGQSEPTDQQAPAGVPGVGRTKPLNSTEQKELFEQEDVISIGEGVISNLERALQLSDAAYFGPTAVERAKAASLLPGGSEEANATLELDNILGENALSSLKMIFGGAPTEGERKILLDLQASAEKPPSVRKAIINRAIQAAQRKIRNAQKRAEGLRTGDIYQPQEVMRPPQQDLRSKYGL